MDLLVKPALEIGEGPQAFLRRLADANLIAYRDVRAMGLAVDARLLRFLGYAPGDDEVAGMADFVERMGRLFDEVPAIWIRRSRRWCPACLNAHPIGRIGWELQFADACGVHGNWLVDTCCACQNPLGWERGTLLQCECGAPLAACGTRAAPPAVVRLAGWIEQCAIAGSNASDPFAALSAPQLIRLVRFLGAYGGGQMTGRPRKIGHLDRLAHSWPLSSLAAEILCDWPEGFFRLAKQILASRPSSGSGRMGDRFGHFYGSLYRSFPEAAFGFLRQVFEAFVADHWTGALARRNRRLSESVLARAVWLPAGQARHRLGVSRHRLASLIHGGQIAAETRISAAGRTFTVVRRDEVEATAVLLQSEFDVKSAAIKLGLTRHRLTRLLPYWLPHASKVGPTHGPWVLPAEKIDSLLSRCSGLPTRDATDREQVSLRHIVKYHAWTNQEIAALLDSIHQGVVVPRARQSRVLPGLMGVLFNRAEIDALKAGLASANPTLFSVPEVAEQLDVKQEVAYALIRLGLIRARNEKAVKLRGVLVRQSDLAAFHRQYVFGRDLAEQIGRSPRWVADGLAVLGITMVAGPALGNCRQIIYRRGVDLDRALGTLGHRVGMR